MWLARRAFRSSPERCSRVIRETLERGKFEVSTDKRVVWVNGADGTCLGRFGLWGIDIHNELRHMAEKGQCLDCTHSKPTLADWRRFVEGMKNHHGVEVSDEYRPRWVKE